MFVGLIEELSTMGICDKCMKLLIEFDKKEQERIFKEFEKEKK